MAWEAVDPLIHVMYVLAYAALARGALGQHQLLAH
jgi:hypothetical protein